MISVYMYLHLLAAFRLLICVGLFEYEIVDRDEHFSAYVADCIALQILLGRCARQTVGLRDVARNRATFGILLSCVWMYV